MNLDTSDLEQDEYKQPSIEELSVGQVLWFGEWLETVDRNVKEDDINAPVIWCATIKEIELISYQKGFVGNSCTQPDIKQYVVSFEEGGREMTFYVGHREELNPAFYLDKDVLLTELTEDLLAEVTDAEERLCQAERDLDRYRAWAAMDIPTVSKTAIEEGFRWTTIMDKQREIDAATQSA